MNISRLYQRAHALRMAAKSRFSEQVPAEFYVGVALADCIGDLTQTRNAAEILRRFVRIRGFAPYPASWPDDIAEIWTRLLRTYGERPRLLLAIADGIEA